MAILCTAISRLPSACGWLTKPNNEILASVYSYIEISTLITALKNRLGMINCELLMFFERLMLGWRNTCKGSFQFQTRRALDNKNSVF
jgi:hypothetical protein